MIERAYREAETAGIALCNQDEAGPYQTVPYPGAGWTPQGEPARQSHEYVRTGTAELLTLFRPATGEVWAKGVTHAPNAVLHPWLKEELAAILATLPEVTISEDDRPEVGRWATWLGHEPREPLPPFRLILVGDNLTGHHTPDFILWLFAHGIMPLFTPLGGSHLNMAESIQRILKRRALDGQHPKSPGEIIAWLEATARAWNREPTPFEWGGKRQARRQRARERRHALGGSGAYTRRPLRCSRAA